MIQNTHNVRTRREQLSTYPESVCVGRYSDGSWQLRRDGDDLDADLLIEGPVLYVRCDIAHRSQIEAEERAKELEAVLSRLLETEEVTDPSKPRVLDLAYTAFMSGCCGKNPDDGGKCDWFTDTRPQIIRHIKKARAALTREGGV